MMVPTAVRDSEIKPSDSIVSGRLSEEDTKRRYERDLFQVKLCESLNGEVFAVKVFSRVHSEEKIIRTVTQEAGNLKRLRHRNLVNLIEVIEKATYTKKDGSSYTTAGIVLEYCQNRELFEYLLHSGKFSEETSCHFFKQLLDGIEYLHAQNVCHRDLKPENILLDSDFNLRIADFGFSTRIEGRDGSGYLKSCLGTEGYMAPEILEKKKYMGHAVDIFAAGIILFIMITGHPPFHKASTNDPYYKLIITNRNATFWEAHSKNKDKKAASFSEDFIDLINGMLAYSPENRSSLAEVLSHRWLATVNKSDKSDISRIFTNRRKIVAAQIQVKLQEQARNKEKKKQLERERMEQESNVQKKPQTSLEKAQLSQQQNQLQQTANKTATFESIGKTKFRSLEFSDETAANQKQQQKQIGVQEDIIRQSETKESLRNLPESSLLITGLNIEHVMNRLISMKGQFCDRCQLSEKKGDRLVCEVEAIKFTIKLELIKDDGANGNHFEELVLLSIERSLPHDFFKFLAACKRVHELFALYHYL